VSHDAATNDDTREWMEGLYYESGLQLLAYLSQRTGDAASAEDLLQETFAAALRHPERVRSASSARAYLFGIARNLAATASRSVRHGEPLPPDLAVEDLPADPRVELLRTAIAGLKPEFREVLELRLQQELSYNEIAEALGVPLGTVRSRLHYSLNQLRRTLRPADPGALARKEQL
jgi:RNA polymerase sigma-70 factor (ECF subfamily)